MCSHVAVLQTGTLLVAGELQTLLDADTGGLVVEHPRRRRRDPRPAGGGCALVPRRGRGRGAAGPLEAPEIVAALVAAGVAVWEVHRRRAHLEELFARLTEEDA